ncbi:hypothetical protein D3C80_1440480 [compost metagenome]
MSLLSFLSNSAFKSGLSASILRAIGSITYSSGSSAATRVALKKPQAQNESGLSGYSRLTASTPNGWSVSITTEPAGKVCKRSSGLATPLTSKRPS